MKKYDLSFMSEYIKLKKISVYDLVGIFYLEVDEIMDYFNGIKSPEESFLLDLYKYMNVKNYSELYNKVNKEVEKIKDENKISYGFEKKYNISFLFGQNIDIKSLSIYCSISEEELKKYISGKNLTPISIVNKICEYFNVKTIDELKNENKINLKESTLNERAITKFSFIENSKNEKKENIKNDNIDVLLLVEFLKYKKIKISDFEKYLKCNLCELNNILSIENNKKEELKIKIFDFFNVKNYSELNVLFEDYLNLDKCIIDLKDYINRKGIKLKDISINTGISSPQISKILNGECKIKEIYIEEILSYLNIKDLDELKKQIDNSIDVKKFIKYLKKYMKIKKITLKDLSNGLKISHQYINSLLNGRRVLNEIYINKILGYLNIKDYDELKKQVENSIDTKEFIKYLKKYMKINKITLEELSKATNISYSYINSIVNERYNINELYINKILQYLKIKDFEELKKVLCFDNIYIKKYMKIKKITLEDLSNATMINVSTLSQMINGKCYIDENLMNEILKFLNIRSFDKLKEFVSNYDNDIIFLNDYLNYLSIDQEELSNYIGCSRATINYALNGKQTLNNNMMCKLLEYFKVKNILELKEQTKEIKKIDLSFLRSYFEYENITLEEFSKIIGCSYKTLSLMINDNTKIKKIYYERILKYFNVSNYNDLLNKLKYEKSEDITFIKPYLILNGITQSEFAKILNCGITNVNKALNGIIELQPIYINNLLKYFNFTDFKSFKDYIYLILNKNDLNIIDYTAISLIFTKNNINEIIDKLSSELNIEKNLLKYSYEKYKLMYIKSINSRKKYDNNIHLYKLNH